jgi:cytochrome c-type biogenesis protein CcmE/acylphosphatase
MNKFVAGTALSLLTLSIMGCGGGSNNSEQNPPTQQQPQATVGSAKINVLGLPAGSNASISLSGPNGYSKTLTTAEELKDLVVGDYMVTATAVTVNGVNYSASNPEQTLTISENQTATLDVAYQSPIVSSGVITGFGSVYINGVRFNTDNAAFSTDDKDSDSEDSLQVGMVVTLEGAMGANGETPTASKIKYNASAEGPVSEINLAEQSFTVLGQVYYVDEFTEFDDELTFEALLVDDYVEVSAKQNADEQWFATRVEKSSDSEEVKLQGTVTELNIESKQFNIGTLIIDYSSADVEGELANDVMVKIKASNEPVDNVLTADEVEVKTMPFAAGQKVFVEGEIDDFESASLFEVNDQVVTTNEQTVFAVGKLEDLQEGIQVVISGALNAENQLVAHLVRFKQATKLKLEGLVSEVDEDDNEIELMGTTVTVNEFTQFIDVSKAKVRRFRLDDINAGDKLVVKASKVADDVIARQVKRFKVAADVSADEFVNKLEGEASAISEMGFTVEGIRIETSELTKFEADNGDALLQAEFFELLVEGDEVEVKAVQQEDGTFLAIKVEIDNDNDAEEERYIDLEGVIDSFMSLTEFSVNGHAVTTQLNTRYAGFNPEQLAVGVAVEVKGELNQENVIVARKIELDSEDDSDEREADIEGKISEFTSAQSFKIGDQVIVTNEQTEFKHGTAADLALDVEIEVEGEINNDGALVAKKVEFAEQDEFEVEGKVTEFTSNTDFSIGEQKITTTTNTEFKNGSASMLQADVVLEVEGTLNENQVLVAKKVEFEEIDEVEVEGEVTQFISLTDFVVDGKSITTNANTRFVKGASTQLKQGVKVEIKGFYDENQVLVATKVKFEN